MLTSELTEPNTLFPLVNINMKSMIHIKDSLNGKMSILSEERYSVATSILLMENTEKGQFTMQHCLPWVKK